ncbi:fibronectin type III domain-containing protein [Thermoanaerobacter siderophilus]|uniref:Endopolygalacturonase n=1 Tax=Thermoanaerobacter siderophilus SR4 TaxID=880478 RepID=I9KRX2_9THEO|nr:glycosyl hydrolase family 28 protein [Thermoanaerobacter siderophilus]EIV99550.1 endopolygalacturonase [Thermoanaerobacter siderophilus SR4]
MGKFVKWPKLLLKAGLALLLTTVLPFTTAFGNLPKNEKPSPPVALRVLDGSLTSNELTLIWEKPDNYQDITDFKIVVRGPGYYHEYFASDNPTVANQNYIKLFYEQHIGELKNDEGKVIREAYKILMHSFYVKGLKPNTEYVFSVQSVGKNGELSVPVTITYRTRPTIPASNIINIESMGAIGDGTLADDINGTPSSGTLNTEAIQRAIDACPPGGIVLVPAGKIYLTGPITLHSNMTLLVEGTLLGTVDANQYPNPFDTDKTRIAEKSMPLISTPSTGTYENIKIIGHGVINGNGWAKVAVKETSIPLGTTFDQYQKGNSSNIFTTAKNHLALNQFNKYIEQGEKNAYATRSNLIDLKNVTNVYIGDGLTVTNPSYHTISCSNCKNVILNQLIASTYDCNNGDGIDFNGTGLIVVNSVFNTGDDSVNFEAGVGLAGEKNPPTENAWIFNNYFGRGHGVVAMGSHTAAWIQNILAEDNVINGNAVGLRGKSQSGNGGGARNIIFRDSALANITDNDGSPFLLTVAYSSAPPTDLSNWAPDEPTFHDILIKNCTVNGTKKYAILIQGSPDGYDYNLTFDNIYFGAGTYQTKMAYLKNCTFNNVVFYGSTPNYDGNKKVPVNPWFATNASSLMFKGITTSPDPFLAPNWPVDSKVVATIINRKEVNITWSPAVDRTFTKYLIKNGDETVAILNADTISYTITGLLPNKDYQFTIYAVNEENNMTEGPSVFFKTTNK